ncbi:hypothetical protein KM043_016093 [Ampulex compressa]|nr:hypothetical protein KM043_016093 [Ampulex compressa]
MTSLILENADLNRLFPKCRPRGGPPPPPGGSTQINQPHESLCQAEADAITTIKTIVTTASLNTVTTGSVLSDDMIDLERDTIDRQVILIVSFQFCSHSLFISLTQRRHGMSTLGHCS